MLSVYRTNWLTDMSKPMALKHLSQTLLREEEIVMLNINRNHGTVIFCRENGSGCGCYQKP